MMPGLAPRYFLQPIDTLALDVPLMRITHTLRTNLPVQVIHTLHANLPMRAIHILHTTLPV